MQIKREVFLELCAALSVVGCPGSHDDAGAVRAATVVDVEPTRDGERADPPPRPVAPPEPECGATDTTMVCDQVGPACEGLHDSCLRLSNGLRPPIASAWSKCFAQARPPGCRDASLGACMRDAIEESCPLPEMRSRCAEVMAACRDAGHEPQYTMKLCMQVASAVTPDDDPMGWERVDWKRMGPLASTMPCTLEYVLPYQPFGWMWRDAHP